MNSLLNHDGLRKFFSGRRRFQIGWIFAILLVLSARQYPSFIGIFICFLGATLRFWSSGYLRKEAKLAVGGPYSHSRNPLYLGWFIMAFGAAISVGAPILALVMGFVFFLTYHYVIEHEETKLPECFGQSYHDYCALVPRFWPRMNKPSRAELMKINSDPVVYDFSMPLAKENKAFEAYATCVGLIAAMALIVWVKSILGLIHP